MRGGEVKGRNGRGKEARKEWKVGGEGEGMTGGGDKERKEWKWGGGEGLPPWNSSVKIE